MTSRRACLAPVLTALCLSLFFGCTPPTEPVPEETRLSDLLIASVEITKNQLGDLASIEIRFQNAGGTDAAGIAYDVYVSESGMINAEAESRIFRGMVSVPKDSSAIETITTTDHIAPWMIAHETEIPIQAGSVRVEVDGNDTVAEESESNNVYVQSADFFIGTPFGIYVECTANASDDIGEPMIAVAVEEVRSGGVVEMSS